MASNQFRQFIKSKLVYTVLMRPKNRPKHVSAVIQRHVKNHFHPLLAEGRASALGKNIV